MSVKKRKVVYRIGTSESFCMVPFLKFHKSQQFHTKIYFNLNETLIVIQKVPS